MNFKKKKRNKQKRTVMAKGNAYKQTIPVRFYLTGYLIHTIHDVPFKEIASMQTSIFPQA